MLQERKIQFDFGEVTFRKSLKAKYLRIKIHPEQGIVVSIPRMVSEERAINFVIEKERWIRKGIRKVGQTVNKITVFTRETEFSTFNHKLVLETHKKQSLRLEKKGQYLIINYPKNADIENPKIQEFIRQSILRILRLEAKQYLPVRVTELARLYGFRVNEVKVRNNKTRWGSCSTQNNINLNIHLMRLPQPLIDYVIYHELVHTEIRDHSKKYWDRLEEVFPGAKKLDKELNNYNLMYW